VKIGIHPDWGGTWFLPRLVGPGRALELLTTGRMVDAAEALAIGMLDRVVPLTDLLEQTTALARAIAQGPPQAIADMKRALAASRTNSLSAQVELESEHQVRAFLSRDAGEGMAAFFEKRAAEFEGE
jgi:2-(1,2-epoxy-1,2-dihydrophenyl)acetyl-CoA isomerase